MAAIGSRLARFAPDYDLFYGEWHIPSSIPVGMTAVLFNMDESLSLEPTRFGPDYWVDIEVRRKSDKMFAPFSRGLGTVLGIRDRLPQ